MNLLRLDQISEEGVNSLKSSFENLPETSHKDGKFRLRRYSVIEVMGLGADLSRIENKGFTQSAEVNEYQGDVLREFEEIEDSVIESAGMRELILLFKDNNNLNHGHEVGIHQFRIVIRKYDSSAIQPAPEGVHQDGFNKLAIASINRTNIQGGAVQVFRGKHYNSPILSSIPRDGEVVNIDDKKLWHYAEEVKLINPTKEAYWDAFVLTAHLAK